MDLFECRDSAKFLRARLEMLPKQGYGQARVLARHLGVSGTLVSQLLQGQKQLSLDQAYLAAEFFTLHDLESRYFLTLVQWEKAAKPGLKRYLDRELTTLRDQSRRVENRLTHQAVLSEEQRAEFYSDWRFSAIRLLTSIPGFETAQAIGGALRLPKKTLQSSLHFLVEAGLVVEEGGRYRIGPLSTHVGADSRWVKLHHRNWRDRALASLERAGARDLHYTSPMTLSRADAEKIKTQLLLMIEEIGKTVDASPSEELRCLNLDWFTASD